MLPERLEGRSRHRGSHEGLSVRFRNCPATDHHHPAISQQMAVRAFWKLLVLRYFRICRRERNACTPEPDANR